MKKLVSLLLVLVMSVCVLCAPALAEDAVFTRLRTVSFSMAEYEDFYLAVSRERFGEDGFTDRLHSGDALLESFVRYLRAGNDVETALMYVRMEMDDLPLFRQPF